jgi:hypothetical protein
LVSVELVSGSDLIDPEIINNAAASVLHYFKVELCRDTVTLGEFSEVLERVLRKFGVAVQTKLKEKKAPPPPPPPSIDQSLAVLASEAGSAGELAFFPKLRDVVRIRLEQAPAILCFSELRTCVKRLAGARRWSPRCRTLEYQIVEFLRNCVSSDSHGRVCSLMVR